MYEVIGIQKVDYINKKGRHVKGIKVFATYHDDKIDGLGTIDFYLRDDRIPDSLELMDKVDVFYNRYGDVDSLVVRD